MKLLPFLLVSISLGVDIEIARPKYLLVDISNSINTVASQEIGNRIKLALCINKNYHLTFLAFNIALDLIGISIAQYYHCLALTLPHKEF